MAKPKSLEIRGYNVGFGDCFLLSFDYGKNKKHVLIDFGTTQPPAGKTPTTYMLEVAEEIKKICEGHLDAIVETHRHADHISGFATGTKQKASGDVIRECTGDDTVIVHPWTEDPDAPKDSTGPKGSVSQTPKAFVAQLENMHSVAEAAVKEARRMNPERMDADTTTEREVVATSAKGRPEPSAAGDEGGAEEGSGGDEGAVGLAPSGRADVTGSTAGKRLMARLAFIGEDNVKNLSAVKNLMSMSKPKNHHYVFFGADSGLEDILPGVKVQVLGPPTIKQSNAVLKQRSADKEEFWMLRQRFWSTQRLAAGDTTSGSKGTPLFPKAKTIATPRSSRWFVRRLRGVRAKSLLELVTILDTVMNNTSVILLFEAGGKKLLFPGDAQIENWSYALLDEKNSKKILPLLADVDVYKVGHHGSRNATPKTLYDNFKKRGAKKDRLMSLISTKSGKHGTASSHTEVPRGTLVKALKADTDYHTTQDVKASGELCFVETVEF